MTYKTELEKLTAYYESLERRNERVSSPYGRSCADRDRILRAGGDPDDDGTSVEYHCEIDLSTLDDVTCTSECTGERFISWSRRKRPYWSLAKDGEISPKRWGYKIFK